MLPRNDCGFIVLMYSLLTVKFILLEGRCTYLMEHLYHFENSRGHLSDLCIVGVDRRYGLSGLNDIEGDGSGSKSYTVLPFVCVSPPPHHSLLFSAT